METRIVDSGGHRAIEVIYRDVTPGNHESWTVPIGSLAVYGELLGYAEPVEALEAVVYILKNGLPEHCPVTGKNVFTDAFTLLTHRECQREAAAEDAASRGADSDTIRAKSSKAAYDAVHQKPAGGGDCAMDACRREARRQIGVKEPTVICGEETRIAEPVVARQMSRISTARDPDAEFKATVSEALAPYTGEMARSAREWLHGLTGSTRDPLTGHLPDVTPPPAPEVEELPENPILSADELIQKFGGTT